MKFILFHKSSFFIYILFELINNKNIYDKDRYKFKVYKCNKIIIKNRIKVLIKINLFCYNGIVIRKVD